MKSKKRHHSSSEESDVSVESNTSSNSESDESSFLDQRQHKKKRKRAAESSESESDSDDQRRAKKRKHKKKKKKHGKKKRRSASVEDSNSDEDISSVSDGEISSKKKRKHKHKQKHAKRDRSSSVSERDESRGVRRLHSVVKDRRVSSENGSPSRTYYQKEYQRSTSRDYERECEVQRFYRGSSKDTRQEHYTYDREHADNRYAQYQQQGNYSKSDKEGYSQSYNSTDPKRHSGRYEGHRTTEDDYHRKQRDEAYYTRDAPKTYNRYNQYEDSRAKRREYEEGRDYRDREKRAPPEPERYRDREYTEKKDRYRDDKYSPERGRDQRREGVARPERNDRSTVPTHKEQISRSPDRYKERGRRAEHREEREERYREERGDRERRDDRPPVKHEPRARERKTRFTDTGDSKEYSWGKEDSKKEGDKPGDKEKPNFGLSGKLTADVNTVNGVVIKYTEPDDAKQPKRRWRFYPFKGDKALPILYIHRQSAFLLGRDKKVVDIMLEHPSVSKQHAALQYRATPFTRSDGTQGRRVRPYIIDLESANGTFVNNKKIDPRRYVELLERDVVKFGFSQREYVLLHENSKDDALDDDQPANTTVGDNVTTTDQIKQEKRVKQEVAEDGE